MIERCIFVLCLDKKVPIINKNCETKENEIIDIYDEELKFKNNSPAKTSSEVMTWQALHMLHGLGSENNSGNRWFDKTMQFIIAEDGVCGVNYEHSAAEGIVVIELSEHLFRYM